jgi:membrane dipeptidase
MSLTRRSLLRSLPLTGFASAFNIRAQESKPLWATGNPAIDKPREIAIQLLNPTQAQIEHAWELHFGSLVFESYGFAPRFAVDGEAFNKAVEDGATSAELSDLREGMTMNGGAINERERQEFLEAFHAAGVTCVFQNAAKRAVIHCA